MRLCGTDPDLTPTDGQRIDRFRLVPRFRPTGDFSQPGRGQLAILANTRMKPQNQTHLRGFNLRRLKSSAWAIVLAQSLEVSLAALGAIAQTRPATTATNATVSTSEVMAFRLPTSRVCGLQQPERRFESVQVRRPRNHGRLCRDRVHWQVRCRAAFFRLPLDEHARVKVNGNDTIAVPRAPITAP
jgi:hypothetical protein